MTRRFRILISILIVSLVCVCSLSTFFANYSVSLYAAERFATAQRQWEANNIQNYEVVVQVVIPLSDFWQYRIVVQDGVIQEAGRRSPLLVGGVASDFSAESFTPIPASETESYTIDGLMSYARNTVATTPTFELRACDGKTYWDADYDIQYSYVRSLHFTCGGGFLGCPVSDCDGGYTVLNFTPLP